MPVIFTGVSAYADYGYIFIQETTGPCLSCLFPDVIDDARYPCPATPAMSDVLQAVGALTAYALDALATSRPSHWNYRTVRLSNGSLDANASLSRRLTCDAAH